MIFKKLEVALFFATSTFISQALSGTLSTYIWHRSGERGEPVTDESLSLLWNDSTTVSIRSTTNTDDRILSINKDYSISGPNITFHSTYLSTFFDPNGSFGIKAKITVHFSDGANHKIQAVQWDTPQPVTTDFVVNDRNVDRDLRVSMEFRGLDKMAGVMARMINGSYLFGDKGKGSGPSQQGQLEYRKCWDYDAKHVIIKSGVLQAVLEANITTGLTFQFYPRIHTNTVNFTIGLIEP